MDIIAESSVKSSTSGQSATATTITFPTKAVLLSAEWGDCPAQEQYTCLRSAVTEAGN